MVDISVPLTDTQEKCMEYCAVSPSDWINNAAQNRARIAQDEIIAKLVEHCNANSVQLATGVDAQVEQAFELKVVQTAKEVSEANNRPSIPEE